jgi:hypothetical protein
MVSKMVSFEQVDGYCNASTIAQPFFQWAYLAGNSTTRQSGPTGISRRAINLKIKSLIDRKHRYLLA